MSAYAVAKTSDDRGVAYMTMAPRVDRASLEPKKEDAVLVSDAAVYLFSWPKPKLRARLSLADLHIKMSPLWDGTVILFDGADASDKGQFIIDAPKVVELVAHVALAAYDRGRGDDLLAFETAIELKGKRAATVVFKSEGARGFLSWKESGVRVLQVTAPKIASW